MINEGALDGRLVAYTALRVMAGAEPGYVCREEPVHAWDSGWRVFVGDETQADAENAEHFQINRLDTLTAEHPRLADLFRVGVSGSFEWDQATSSYARLGISDGRGSLPSGKVGVGPMSRSEFAHALDGAGLWNHLPTDERDAAKAAVSAGQWPLDTIGQEGWIADGEDLAEGDVEIFLNELAPALKNLGIDLHVETPLNPHADGSPGYAVTINGILVDLYSFDPTEPGLPLTDDPWTDCTLKPLAVVNKLLFDAGCPERVAVLYPGGNDGIAYLLPIDAIKVMQESAEVEPRDRPVAP